MLKIKTEITYDLLAPIVMQDGSQISCLTMKAPKNTSRQYSARLGKMIISAMKEAMNSSAGDKEGSNDLGSARKHKSDGLELSDEESAEQFEQGIITALYSSASTDIIECHEVFQKLMTSNNMCTMDNGAPITPIIYKELYCDDTDAMLAKYLANFCMPSLMRPTLKK